MAVESQKLVPQVGNRVIDHFHQRLALILFEARLAARVDGGAGVLAKANHFREVIASHFAHEEVILRGAGFAESKSHGGKHIRILGEIDAALRGLAAADRTEERFAVIDTLERTLFDHEILDDSRYHTLLRGEVPDLAWNDLLSVGVPEIDRQHRELTEWLVATQRFAETDGAADEIRARLDHFAEMARGHFAHEEQLLADRGEMASSHRHHHGRLLEQLGELIDAYEGQEQVALCSDYLRFWLLDHIVNVDQPDFAAL